MTARGGMTSHAAVVARGMGKPAITGCGAIEINNVDGRFMVGDLSIHAGEEITIDGTTGRVFLGRVAMVEPELTGGLDRLLAWADRAAGGWASAPMPTPRPTRSVPGSQALRASASVGPSTCSSARAASTRCGR